MGWNIGLVNNTVEITAQCAADLWTAVASKGSKPWYCEEEVTADTGRLYFNSDHMEHMDYMHDKRIQAVLKQHRVNGDVTFGSMDGDNRGCFWGYRFVDGKMTKLQGRVVFEPAST